MNGVEIAARVATMDESEAADILTWTDEPELLEEPGEPIPVFSDVDIAAARIIGETIARQYGHGSRLC